MAKLYVHGHAVADYTKEFTALSGGKYKVIYRLMSDGKLLKNLGRGWKIAHVKPEIAADPNSLIAHGYIKEIKAVR
jgi:hypothetical protein